MCVCVCVTSVYALSWLKQTEGEGGGTCVFLEWLQLCTEQVVKDAFVCRENVLLFENRMSESAEFEPLVAAI